MTLDRTRTSPRQGLVRQDLATYLEVFFDDSNTPYSRCFLGLIMPREAELSLNERAFVLDALKEDIRLDGRALDAFRDVEIAFGDEYGTADVKMGKTRYRMKGVQREIENL